MKFQVSYLNELPFLVELQDDKYEVKTQFGVLELQVNSKWYKVHTARFAKHAGDITYVGDKSELENIITNNAIANYAFDNCKTFVSCSVTLDKDITDNHINSVCDEKAKEKFKSHLIKIGRKHDTTTEELNMITSTEYEQLSLNEREKYKEEVIYDDTFQSFNNIYAYYEALNNFIIHYADTRDFYWVQKLNENTLEGTMVREYIDGKLYNSFTHAGLVPSILPHKRKYPDISDQEMDILKDKLKNGAKIPVERSLILIAKSLWLRLEYRSAIIESSAALEYVVERKLVDKMKTIGKTPQFIRDELEKTKTNFYQRCNHFLKLYTGKSFVQNNSALWATIDSHRKNYRHPITHSNVEPDKKTTEDIIKDFESAITYVNGL